MYCSEYVHFFVIYLVIEVRFIPGLLSDCITECVLYNTMHSTVNTYKIFPIHVALKG